MAVVKLSSTARAEILRLPPPIVERMEKLIKRLANWPAVSGSKSLRGKLAGRYRLRTGDYRLQFQVETRKTKNQTTREETIEYTIIVEKAGHRDGFYE
jgi:mRNA-degrading endonuclease RelE of RelBE toxin-antitoxin system